MMKEMRVKQRGKQHTPSQKQPFSFLGQLAIISARHARQLFSSVPVGV